MIVKGFVIFERTILSRKESHKLVLLVTFSTVLINVVVTLHNSGTEAICALNFCSQQTKISCENHNLILIFVRQELAAI